MFLTIYGVEKSQCDHSTEQAIRQASNSVRSIFCLGGGGGGGGAEVV